ncbi:MAG: phosphatase PAP2 family protein [Flavobacteriales bacterium]
MLEWIRQIDHDLFLFINGHNAPWADHFFYCVSLRWVWIPVYLLFIWLLVKQYGYKTGFTYTAIIVVSVIVADVISSQLFKELFHRLRPCHNPVLAGNVHTYENDCGGLYGFVSSHAANFATWCTLGFLLLRKKIRFIGFVFLASFLLVGYSRIYLGRHYPLDVWAGMMLGMGIAILVYWRIKRFYNKEAVT